ncbi:MAG: ribonuclease domain-containing protein [Luteimonas sp.]
MRRYGWLVVAVVLLALWTWQQRPHAPAVVSVPPVSMPGARMPVPRSLPPAPGTDAGWPAFLPPEAIDTLQRIARGGPFEHRQDGATFQNRERRLPPQARGYYREYTVETPGSRDRGARRIIVGGGTPGDSPPIEYFYSDDHYRRFRRFTAGAQR